VIDALARFPCLIPADLGAPVFIVQHMPALSTGPLAASLAAKSAIRVKEAVDGEEARANCAYIAPGGMQMKLVAGSRGEITIKITSDPPENNCKPAVDYLFRSAALQDFSSLGRFDVVFCRNVEIYFNDADRRKLFARMERALEPGGALVIGAMESLTGIAPQFESKRHLRSIFDQAKNGTGGMGK
jgi:SAM-dependent methyltransferase